MLIGMIRMVMIVRSMIVRMLMIACSAIVRMGMFVLMLMDMGMFMAVFVSIMFMGVIMGMCNVFSNDEGIIGLLIFFVKLTFHPSITSSNARRFDDGRRLFFKSCFNEFVNFRRRKFCRWNDRVRHDRSCLINDKFPCFSDIDQGIASFCRCQKDQVQRPQHWHDAGIGRNVANSIHADA